MKRLILLSLLIGCLDTAYSQSKIYSQPINVDSVNVNLDLIMLPTFFNINIVGHDLELRYEDLSEHKMIRHELKHAITRVLNLSDDYQNDSFSEALIDFVYKAQAKARFFREASIAGTLTVKNTASVFQGYGGGTHKQSLKRRSKATEDRYNDTLRTIRKSLERDKSLLSQTIVDVRGKGKNSVVKGSTDGEKRISELKKRVAVKQDAINKIKDERDLELLAIKEEIREGSELKNKDRLVGMLDIDNVQFSVEDGAMIDFIVSGQLSIFPNHSSPQGAEEQYNAAFISKVPIPVARRTDFGKTVFDQYALIIYTEEDNDKIVVKTQNVYKQEIGLPIQASTNSEGYYYVRLSEIINYQIYPSNRTSKFSPAESITYFKHAGETDIPMIRDEFSDIVNFRVYGDALGLADNSPNGLVQFEISKKMLLNARKRMSINHNYSFAFLSSVNWIFELNKIEGRNRELYRRLDNPPSHPEIRTIDLISHRNYTIASDFNLIYADLVDLGSRVSLSGKLALSGVSIKDTLSQSEDVTSLSNFLNYSIGPKWELTPDSRQSIFAEYRLHGIRASDSSYLLIDERNFKSNQRPFNLMSVSLGGRFSTSTSKDSQLFFKGSYWKGIQDNSSSFFQLLLGVSTTIKGRTSKLKSLVQ